MELYQPYYGDRENLKIQPVFPKKYDNIIWIIDCSVNANYLGINDSHYKTTPFLDSISNMYVNSGCVASITNCSSISNIFLMGMGNKNNLPDHGEKLLKQASIFAYAKNANYKTAYISAQSQNNRLQNYMSNFDLEDIDYFYQPTSKEKKDMVYADEYLANKIKDYLTRYNGSFIYVVKSGSHFPWQQNYPIEQAIYKPSLIGSQNISSSDYQTRLNTYLNAIHWKTDHFFRTLLSDFSILDNNKSNFKWITHLSKNTKKELEDLKKAVNFIIIDQKANELNESIVITDYQFIFSKFDISNIMINKWYHPGVSYPSISNKSHKIYKEYLLNKIRIYNVNKIYFVKPSYFNNSDDFMNIFFPKCKKSENNLKDIVLIYDITECY